MLSHFNRGQKTTPTFALSNYCGSGHLSAKCTGLLRTYQMNTDALRFFYPSICVYLCASVEKKSLIHS